jgi:hypothetical protein
MCSFMLYIDIHTTPNKEEVGEKQQHQAAEGDPRSKSRQTHPGGSGSFFPVKNRPVFGSASLPKPNTGTGVGTMGLGPAC